MAIRLLILCSIGFSASVGFAQNCPKVEIEGPSSGWQSTEAWDECSPYSIFVCKSGQMSAIKRSRPGDKDLFQAQCRAPALATKSREELLIEQANREGVTLQELDRRLRRQRETVEPTPVGPQTPTSSLLTANAPMTTDLAALEVGGDLALTQELIEKAKKEGVPDVVLERAFANYKDQLKAGKTKRACFMAGDLTTPEQGQVWIICDTKPIKVIKMPSFYGSGEGANCSDDAYKNKEGCAKYFGNKKDSCLPMGGKYITTEATVAENSKRNLIELQGLDTFNSNARARRIGIHRAVMGDGQTPFSATNGTDASHGCFVLPPTLPGMSDLDLSSGNPGLGMAFYVYPNPSDIKDLVEGKPAYWNESCREKIINPAWVGKDGDHFYDPKAIAKDQVEFINNYYQEESPDPDAPATPTPPDAVK